MEPVLFEQEGGGLQQLLQPHLLLVGGAGVLSIVGQILDVALLDDGVGEDDGGAAAGDQGPDPASLVQNGQLQNEAS